MGLTSRFITYHVFGYPSSRGYSFGFDGRDAYLRALQRPNAAVNLLALGDPAAASETRAFGVTMKGRINFTDTTGETSAWTASSGGTYFEDLPNAFADGTAALQYAYDNGAVGEYFSNTNLVNENRPFAIRYRAYRTEQAYPFNSFQVQGTTEGLGFQVAIAKGKASMMRLTSSWTAARESTLLGWLASTTIDDATQQSIDARRKLIYSDETTINLGGRRNGYAEDHTLIFFPEACGAVTCFDENFRFLGRLEHRDLIHDRTDGVMWTDSTLRVYSNGPALDWQFGQWESPTRGQLRLGPYKTLTSGSWTYQTIVSTPTGTTCSMANETIDAVFDEVVIDFASSDSGVSPIFYAGEAVRLPGTRTGAGAAATFDTDDLAANPIEEITPQLDRMHRRGAYTTRIRDINGAVTQALATGISGTGLEFDYPAGEHLMCDLWIGGVRVLKNGIVKASGHEAMRGATANTTAANVTLPESKLCPVICDQWAILDEFEFDLLAIYPVGDGLKLGAYIRTCLQLTGLETGAIANVVSTTGRKLPQARPGEKWLVQPGSTALGDWLRHLLDLFGDGRQLWIDSDGVWNLGFRSTTSKYAFLKDGAEDRVFSGLSAWRDSSESYNYFRVQGADGPFGLPLVAWWDVYAGYRVPGTPGHPLYIGRRKAYGTVSSSSLVTQNECDRAVRSLRDLHGTKPGKGYRFECFYQPNIFPGDFVTLDGRRLEVMNADSGSIAFGSNVAATNDYKGKMEISGRLET